MQAVGLGAVLEPAEQRLDAARPANEGKLTDTYLCTAAACRCRASWRQRIASGQFVEGYQLLNPSPPAGASSLLLVVLLEYWLLDGALAADQAPSCRQPT